jgi:aminopeptidase N
MSKKVKRLFAQYAPENYKIHLTISEDKLAFTGSMTITGRKTGRPSKRITLHQKGLKISNVTLLHTNKASDVTEIPVKRLVLQQKFDEARIHTETTIYPGSYAISIDFSGSITKNMDGVYPCYYKEGGVTKELVATQFESHHAREAFPCIDEPEAKATFDLSITHALHEKALSNTPILSEKVFSHNKLTVFEQTPIMSTYLLAFVVGELSYREAYSKNGVKIRTYATKDQIDHSQFALETAVACMDFYEEYYAIPFPLAKCDFVALPDFASGAMENWGLITFREQTLLCDDKNTSLSTKQYVAIVVAHELTHQWFGNLVTMRWWTDLWLNEGFASWMEYLAIDKLFPNWHVWTQFAVDDQQLALKIDSLEHTHPIEVTVKHPDEIRTIFDAISYQKGASVIHMLHEYLGADGFRGGLRHYLKKHAYKNTDTIDLWQALEDVTKKPVKKFMGAWTSQTGFPLLIVEAKSDHLLITQSRFVSNPQSTARHDPTTWPIPLLCDGLDRAVIEKATNHIPFTEKQSPVKLNIGQTGFYRVNYSHALQQMQIAALRQGTMHFVDRMGLLSDSFEVTKAGYQPVSEYLDLLSQYADEDSLTVWEIIASSIGSIRSVLSKSDTNNTLRDAMKPFIRDLVKIQHDRLTWDEQPGESHLDTLLRPMIIGLITAADSEKDVKKALALYQDRITGDNHVNPDLRGVVYATAARKGGSKEFHELLRLYKKTNSSDEKLSITAALTNFEQSELQNQVLELILTDTVRLQDKSYWIAYSFMNRHSRIATWQWLKDNWKWLKDNLGTDLSFSRMPIYAARTFTDQTLINDYVDFFSPRLEPLIERSYYQGLEIAQTAAAWKERDSDCVLQWLQTHTR